MKISVQLPEGQAARQAALQKELVSRWGHGFTIEVLLTPDLRDSEGNSELDHMQIDFSPGGEAFDVLTRIQVWNLVRNVVRATRPKAVP